jgi:hypothetical protein
LAITQIASNSFPTTINQLPTTVPYNPAMTPDSLGFAAPWHNAWTKTVRGQEILFRALTDFDECRLSTSSAP